MKFQKTHIIEQVVMILLIAFLYSCSEDSGIEGDKEEIKFNLQMKEYSTRAVSTFGPITLSTLKSSADGFAVCTSGLGSGKEMSNLIVKYASNVWGYTGNYFWSINPATNVTFAAYAPAGTTKVTLTSSGLTASGFVPTGTPGQQIDLIYAAPAGFNRGNSGTNGVSLNFKHLLTQVVFSVTTTYPSSSSPMIKSLALGIANNKGSFNGTVWSVSKSSQNYTLFNNNSLSSTPVTSTPLLLLPQTLPSGTTITFTVYVSGTPYSKTVDLSTLPNVKVWQIGYLVTYNISISNVVRNANAQPEITVTAETSEGFL